MKFSIAYLAKGPKGNAVTSKNSVNIKCSELDTRDFSLTYFNTYDKI